MELSKIIIIIELNILFVINTINYFLFNNHFICLMNFNYIYIYHIYNDILIYFKILLKT